MTFDMNNPDDAAIKIATQYLDYFEEKYRRENPCPSCGSHNVGIEIHSINGAHMSGAEWCNECGWAKETES